MVRHRPSVSQKEQSVQNLKMSSWLCAESLLVKVSIWLCWGRPILVYSPGPGLWSCNVHGHLKLVLYIMCTGAHSKRGCLILMSNEGPRSQLPTINRV